jgi:hypothetical protein
VFKMLICSSDIEIEIRVEMLGRHECCTRYDILCIVGNLGQNRSGLHCSGCRIRYNRIVKRSCLKLLPEMYDTFVLVFLRPKHLSGVFQIGVFNSLTL